LFFGVNGEVKDSDVKRSEIEFRLGREVWKGMGFREGFGGRFWRRGFWKKGLEENIYTMLLRVESFRT
jgi:hypothetical protein